MREYRTVCKKKGFERFIITTIISAKITDIKPKADDKE
jgi:hypothetical protein